MHSWFSVVQPYSTNRNERSLQVSIIRYFLFKSVVLKTIIIVTRNETIDLYHYFFERELIGVERKIEK